VITLENFISNFTDRKLLLPTLRVYTPVCFQTIIGITKELDRITTKQLRTNTIYR